MGHYWSEVSEGRSEDELRRIGMGDGTVRNQVIGGDSTAHAFANAINCMIDTEMAKQEPKTDSKTKVQVSVREVKWLEERRRQINAIDLDDIEWITEDGRVIPYNAKNIEEFSFTGLSNMSFIELGFHDGSVVIDHDDDDPWDNGLGKQSTEE